MEEKMKTVKAIYKTLKKRFDWFESVEKQDNEEVNKFLYQYIYEGKRVFEWDGSEYEILQILNFKKLKICTSLYKFIESPSINYYKNLISERYYTVAENIAYVLSDKISKSRPEEIAMSFFTSLIYYPIDEQILLIKALIATEAGENLCWSELDSKHTLIPLALNLANDYSLKETEVELKNEIKSLIKKYPLSALYTDIYNNFLTDDAEYTVAVFDGFCKYHLEKCIDNPKNFPEFEFPVNQAFPEEILVLLNLRIRAGLDNNMISHPLISPYLPFINQKHIDLDIMLNEQKHLRNKIFTEFNYHPMKFM